MRNTESSVARSIVLAAVEEDVPDRGVDTADAVVEFVAETQLPNSSFSICAISLFVGWLEIFPRLIGSKTLGLARGLAHRGGMSEKGEAAASRIDPYGC